MAKRLFFILSFMGFVPSCLAEPVLFLEYRDKPPYSYSQNGKPAGFLLERTIEILHRAAVPAEFEEVPAKRIINNIEANKKRICSPGWYKTPGREAFARFSLAIHQDKPHLVLANTKSSENIQKISTLKALLASTEFKLGKVAGVSYGTELDAMIDHAAAAVMDSTVTPGELAQMIISQRADYMLIDVEDYKFFLQKKEIDSKKLTILKFKDIPEGLKRYIMCSKQVSSELMQRINQSILPLP
ncbi:transporter substrate-binding domain-containing protein [Chromobacterium haemolyticum]|uniref:Transporter substrate-binding domain-containing protein n=1 Tax=Chromobacterium fluminis TaxID=3044269 RepID=A0ABX0L2A9_9NEIS|nr:transporter substrate-binding domain-containing protein [Chromobacterium haemolyticum]NHR05824.1 transporter substrate-binding domain-containing protein [Chromobacterium haemolyticum]